MPPMENLLEGKRGLVMGVANERSIAWGIAKSLAAHGAELAFAYQGEVFGERIVPLAQSVGSDLTVSCDVGRDSELDAAFAAIEQRWGGMDFLVHAVAYSDKQQLSGRYVDTTRDNFLHTMEISCFSFTDVARRAAALMRAGGKEKGDGKSGGAMLTLTYEGAARVMPNYNVMGVAKAALEASVRYLAADLGGEGIRVNAISAGPMRTLAGSAISEAKSVYRWSGRHAPLGANPELEHVGAAALYLLSDMSSMVTGEIHYVDAGYNIIGMPRFSLLAEPK